MLRGPRSLAAIRDAKIFTENMDYRWQENIDNPELASFLNQQGQPVSHEYGDPLGQIKDGVETG
jgi:hypothetical protein